MWRHPFHCSLHLLPFDSDIEYPPVEEFLYGGEDIQYPPVEQFVYGPWSHDITVILIPRTQSQFLSPVPRHRSPSLVPTPNSRASSGPRPSSPSPGLAPIPILNSHPKAEC